MTQLYIFPSIQQQKQNQLNKQKLSFIDLLILILSSRDKFLTLQRNNIYDMKKEDITAALKALLNEKGISQRELASLIGKDETIISRWLSGKVGISKGSLALIEEKLGVTIDKPQTLRTKKVALITGVTGQDGSYLSEFLLDKGYDVHGIIRRSSVDYRERIAHLEGKPHFHLHYADLGDSMSIVKVVGKVQPDEIYNLAAQSHVQVSFDSPEFTADVDATGVLRVLEAVRACHLENSCRIYQASTSELYGKVEEVPQNENTPFHPYSPYAVAKLYGFWIVKEYREAYNMFCCSGILFNHESERRGETFVTRKITLAAARIAQGLQDCLYLGNLSSLRDWGYAKDYVECMWLILQNKKPEDFVIATGVQHSVREFAYYAFKHAGIELEFRGEGLDETGVCIAGPKKLIGKTLVAVSKDFYRPTDVVNLWGEPTKAKAELGWNPSETSFEQLVKIMVDSDMAKVAGEGAALKVRTNLAEYLEKGIVK